MNRSTKTSALTAVFTALLSALNGGCTMEAPAPYRFEPRVREARALTPTAADLRIARAHGDARRA